SGICATDVALYQEWFREVRLPKSKDFMPTFPAQDRRTRRVLKNHDPLEKQHRKELRQAELQQVVYLARKCFTEAIISQFEMIIHDVFLACTSNHMCWEISSTS
ncbi:hypothetical protein Tco_0071905, partial [Tanacetum coccineum]